MHTFITLQFTNTSISKTAKMYTVTANFTVNNFLSSESRFDSLNTHFQPSTWPSTSKITLFRSIACDKSSYNSTALISLALYNQVRDLSTSILGFSHAVLLSSFFLPLRSLRFSNSPLPLIRFSVIQLL